MTDVSFCERNTCTWTQAFPSTLEVAPSLPPTAFEKVLISGAICLKGAGWVQFLRGNEFHGYNFLILQESPP